VAVGDGRRGVGFPLTNPGLTVSRLTECLKRSGVRSGLHLGRCYCAAAGVRGSGGSALGVVQAGEAAMLSTGVAGHRLGGGHLLRRDGRVVGAGVAKGGSPLVEPAALATGGLD